MRIVRQDVLDRAMRRHTDIVPWLKEWIKTVEEADWRNLQDVREIYPRADGVKLRSELVVTIFDVKGNSYRLLANITYRTGTVQPLDVMTHAEYDKQQWKDRY